jgi:hypothetical protein
MVMTTHNRWVHESLETAKMVAAREADEYPGKQFVVLQIVEAWVQDPPAEAAPSISPRLAERELRRRARKSAPEVLRVAGVYQRKSPDLG